MKIQIKESLKKVLKYIEENETNAALLGGICNIIHYMYLEDKLKFIEYVTVKSYILKNRPKRGKFYTEYCKKNYAYFWIPNDLEIRKAYLKALIKRTPKSLTIDIEI